MSGYFTSQAIPNLNLEFLLKANLTKFVKFEVNAYFNTIMENSMYLYFQYQFYKDGVYKK